MDNYERIVADALSQLATVPDGYIVTAQLAQYKRQNGIPNGLPAIAAVSEAMRTLYIDEKKFGACTSAQRGYVLAHEATHILLGHCKWVGAAPPEDRHNALLAVDMVVWSILSHTPIHAWKQDLACYEPSDFDLKPDMSAPQYLAHLKDLDRQKQEEQQQDQSQDDDDATTEPEDQEPTPEGDDSQGDDEPDESESPDGSDDESTEDDADDGGESEGGDGEGDEDEDDGEGSAGSGEGEPDDASADDPPSLKVMDLDLTPPGNDENPLDPNAGEAGGMPMPSVIDGIGAGAGSNFLTELRASRATDRTDWKAILYKALRDASGKATSSYTRLCRRSLARGLYFPGVVRDKAVSHVGFMLDVSGSMSDSQVQKGLTVTSDACLQIGTQNLVLDMMQFSDGPALHKAYTYHDLPLVKTEIGGRGGTQIAPAFQWFSDNHVDAKLYIIFTDGGIFDLDSCVDPRVPVLWIIDGPARYFQAPFGSVFAMS